MNINKQSQTRKTFLQASLSGFPRPSIQSVCVHPIRIYFRLQFIRHFVNLMAEYEKDENGVVAASVPNISGFFSQGENFEEDRNNLRDAIEGNLLVALQLGFEIPKIASVEIRDIEEEFNGLAF